MTENEERIQQIADYVCKRLAGSMIVHRYDAYSTNSVYLKFDYGAANSLRIADHPGKKYLSYRYNIILGLEKPKEDTRRDFPMYFYPPAMVDKVIEEILRVKAVRKSAYKDYNQIVDKKKNEIDHRKGFWSGAREVIKS